MRFSLFLKELLYISIITDKILYFISVVQDRVLAVWFRDKLALAFGIVVSFIRMGSVLNFLVTSHISSRYGLSTALWIGKTTNSFYKVVWNRSILSKSFGKWSFVYTVDCGRD